MIWLLVTVALVYFAFREGERACLRKQAGKDRFEILAGIFEDIAELLKATWAHAVRTWRSATAWLRRRIAERKSKMV